MAASISPVIKAIPSSHGGHFDVLRLDLAAAGAMAYPVMMLDHYRMRGPTFAPHPHAGLSAVTYLFEDSPGGLRNRDSLQNDLFIEPGALVWTQAGSGIIHDEFPAELGKEARGVQLFINMSAANKLSPPAMFHVKRSDMPVPVDALGNETRVISGYYRGARASFRPKEVLDFFEVKAKGCWSYDVPANRNVLIYVLDGEVRVEVYAASKKLSKHEALAASFDAPGALKVLPTSQAKFLVLSGTDSREPIAVQGPFIMNSQEELDAAFLRYRSGEMGKLVPISPESM